MRMSSNCWPEKFLYAVSVLLPNHSRLAMLVSSNHLQLVPELWSSELDWDPVILCARGISRPLPRNSDAVILSAISGTRRRG